MFDAGAARVVLGTAAFDDVELLDSAIRSHGDRVTVSVDARDGLLAADGWTDQTEIPAAGVIEASPPAACRGSCTRASTATG